MFPQDNGGQPAPQPQAQPEFTIQDLIIDNPANNQPAPQAQQPAEQQPQQQSQGDPNQQPPAQQPQSDPNQQPPAQPAPQQQPQQEEQPVNYPDPYAQSGGVRAVRDKFEQYLDEKFPIKGKLDINQIDKKDPEAFARFMNEMQEASRTDIINQQRREQAQAEFDREIFEPVYQVFPKLKQDPVTDGLVRMLYKGAAADNPNISPVQVVTAFSNFTRQLYNAAVNSAKANVQSIPVTPAGQQGRAATKILNNEVVEKYAGGNVDDVAQLVASMQGRGVGGL